MSMSNDNPGKALERTIRIEVFPDHSAEHGIDFRMYDSANAEPDQAVDELVFSKAGAKKEDYHKITFRLENTKGTNVKFAPKKDDALWVVEGDSKNRPACPKRKPSKKPSGKTLRAITVDDYELVAHNNNNDECEFSFALGVVAASDVNATQVIPLDPGGSNQNGGEDLVDISSNMNVIVGAIAGVALIAVAFMVLR
jgi:hypothetical protein